VKMKQFNWSKIPDGKVTSSYWKDADESGIELDASEIEALFGAKVIEKKEPAPGTAGPDGAAPPAEKKPTGPVTVIDPKRANNGAIMLSRFKISFSDLRKAIMELDESIVTIEGAGALAEYVPTPEEVEQITAFPEEKTKLGKTEQFFWEVKDVPRLGTRLTSFKFKMSFDDQVRDLKPDVDAVLLAIKEVQKSIKLKKLLEIVLALGNYLNGGTFRGRAYGFKLDALNKLRDTKAADNQTTLLHYLVQVVMSKHPDVLDFGRELKHVAPASRVVLSNIQSNIATLTSGFKKLEEEIPLSKSDDPSDRFVPVMTEFVEKRKPVLEELNTGLKAMDEEFKVLSATFGENPDVTPDQFFGNLATFITTFETANKDIVRKREKDAKDAAKKNNPISPRPKPGPGAGPVPAAAMGDVMSQMKGGSFFRNRREQQAAKAAPGGPGGRGGLAPGGRGGPAGPGGRGGFGPAGRGGRGGGAAGLHPHPAGGAAGGGAVPSIAVQQPDGEEKQHADGSSTSPRPAGDGEVKSTEATPRETPTETPRETPTEDKTDEHSKETETEEESSSSESESEEESSSSDSEEETEGEKEDAEKEEEKKDD